MQLIDSGKPAVSGVNMLDTTFCDTYSYDYHHLNDEGMKLMASNIPYLTEIAEMIKAGK